MQFSLSKSGTTDEVRQALYDAERSAQTSTQEEFLAVRALGHVVGLKLDELEQNYNKQAGAIRLAHKDDGPQALQDALATLPKPSCTVSVSATISIS